MRKILIFLTCLVAFPIVGSLLCTFWYSGANTFWKQIDYFPHPVKSIVALKPYGTEFWVETTNNEIYHITYPCLKDQTCWIKADNVPSNMLAAYPVDYNISNNKCENNNYVYPLFHKITMCITSATHAPDATWTVSLALTLSKTLWIWDKPWESPYTVSASLVLSIIIGLSIGLLTGIFFITFNSSKRKGKHP